MADTEPRRGTTIRHPPTRGLDADAGLTVIDDDATAEDKTHAVVDTAQRAERIGRLKAEIAQLEKQRARYVRELEAYRATVAAR